MHDSQHTVGNTYETSKISNRTYTPNKLMTYNSAILCIGVHVHAINCNAKEANSDQTNLLYEKTQLLKCCDVETLVFRMCMNI